MKPVFTFLTRILLLSVLTVGMTVSPAKAQEAQVADTVETRLREQLSKVSSAADSLPIMLNLYDYLQSRSNLKISDELYGVARRGGDYHTILEVTRYMANNYMTDDSVLTVLQENTMQMPEGVDRDVTVTFIKMMKNVNHVRFAPDEETKEKQFQHQLKLATLMPPKDVYERIVLLHALCAYLGDSADSELLENYIDELGELISKLPEEASPLKSMYYIQRALIYTETDYPDKALAADRQSLALIDSLTTVYKDRGRIYRDYGPSLYVIYTRMMYNFPLLTLKEVDELYAKVQEIIKVNPRAALSAESLRPDLYRALAHGRYNEALDILKRCIDHPYNRSKRRKFLRYMIDCAKATGDKETLLLASTQYNVILEEYLKKRLQERYKELQITYDVYDMRENYNALQMEKERMEGAASRRELTVALVFVVALLALVGVLLLLIRRLRHLTRSLEDKNSELIAERNNLEESRKDLIAARNEAERANSFKATFISNFSREVTVPLQIINEYTRLIVDFVDSEHRKHIDHFAKLVKNNSELLNTMINDMLNLSELQNGTVTLHPEVISAKSLCALAIESTRHRANEGVKMWFDEADSTNCDMYADHDRVLQILVNLLLNATKFTESGEIRLSLKPCPEKGMVDFIVTDTGKGIDSDKVEDIFKSFVKLDSDSNVAGLGLALSKSLARLLGGNLKLDTTFMDGARFVLSLPLRQPQGTFDDDDED